MPDISKLNAVAIGDVAKVDSVLAANIEKVNGLTFTSINPDAPTSGFLFTYSGAAAAYSVRQLNNNAPYVMRVRRVTGAGQAGEDDEADVKFDTTLTPAAISLDSPVDNFSANGSNATTLGQFLNVGTVNGTTYTDADNLFPNTAAAYVDAWYDLTGNQNHAEQGTPSAQPQIHVGTAGTDLILENGKPAVEYDGTSTYFQNASFTTSGSHTVFITSKYTTDIAEKVLYDSVTSPQTVNYISGDNKYKVQYGGSWETNITATTSQNLLTFIIDGANSEFFIDGQTQSTGNPGTNNMSGLTLGATRTAAVPWNGNFQEFIFYDSVSTNRTGIETNIDTYFSIT